MKRSFIPVLLPLFFSSTTRVGPVPRICGQRNISGELTNSQIVDKARVSTQLVTDKCVKQIFIAHRTH